MFVEDLKKVCGTVLDVTFPPACPICGQAAPYEDGIRSRVCPDCRKKITYIRQPRCMKCGKALTDEEKEYCFDCTKVEHIYTQGAAVFAYTDGIKQSIYRFKYKNRREYAHFYADEIIKMCDSLIQTWQAQALIPVPLHQSKQRLRGYNQAELIAAILGEKLALPVETNLLERSKKTTPMKELSDSQRIKNVKNAFHINGNIVKYDKVILIDDIYTTGTTIDACASLLLEHGVKNVYFICLCIGKGF